MDSVDEPVLEDPREVVHDEPRAVRAQRLVVELQGDLPLLRGPALRQEDRAGGDEEEHERRQEEEALGTSHGARLLVPCVCVLTTFLAFFFLH